MKTSVLVGCVGVVCLGVGAAGFVWVKQGGRTSPASRVAPPAPVPAAAPPAVVPAPAAKKSHTRSVDDEDQAALPDVGPALPEDAPVPPLDLPSLTASWPPPKVPVPTLKVAAPWPGYPAAVPDPLGIRALLLARRFGDLEKAFAAWMQAFRADPKQESVLMAAMLGFRATEESLAGPLDAWVKAQPGSYLPWAARGTYLKEVGWAHRGTEVAPKTSREAFRRMAVFHKRAMADLQKALELEPAFMPASAALLATYAANSVPRAERMRLLTAARERCPECLLLRLVAFGFMGSNRWSGSPAIRQEMAEEAASHKALNPILGGMDALTGDDKDCSPASCSSGAGLAKCISAAERLPVPSLLVDTGACLLGAGRAAEATPRFEAAVNTSPTDAEALAALAASRWYDDRQEDAYPLLERALVIRRITSRYSEVDNAAAAHWCSLGAKAQSTGDKRQALRWFSLAKAVGAGDPDCLSAFGNALQDTGDTVRARAEWTAVLEHAPGQFEATAGLASTADGKADPKALVATWDAIIAKNPSEGRAYLQRARAHLAAGHEAEASRDAEKACSMGVQAACPNAVGPGGPAR